MFKQLRVAILLTFCFSCVLLTIIPYIILLYVTKSLRHRAERAVLKNSALILSRNYFEGYCFLYEAFSQFKRRRNLWWISNYLFIKTPTFFGYIKIKKCSIIILILNLKFKLLWIYSTNRPSKFSSLFITQKSSIKCFFEWKCLALILSEEISDDISILLHRNIKKWLA